MQTYKAWLGSQAVIISSDLYIAYTIVAYRKNNRCLQAILNEFKK